MEKGERLSTFLPIFLTLDDLSTRSPTFLKYTFFVDVSDIDPCYINHTQYMIIMYPDLKIAEIRSGKKRH